MINSREVAASYQDVISKLGVEISEDKSLVSNDTFEFAKRIFYKGSEITAFPIAGLIECIPHWHCQCVIYPFNRI